MLVHGQSADLALLDVEMPVVTGPEVAQAMFMHDVGLEEVPLTADELTRLSARALAERTLAHPDVPKRVR